MKHLCTLFLGLLLLSGTASAQVSKIWDDSNIFLRSSYYFEDKSAEGDKILLNALGVALDIYSGYAWDIVGIDFTGSGTLATGYGNSEMTMYDFDSNDEKSKAVINTAALKFKFGNDSINAAVRAGYTRLDVGTLGTSWRMNSHGYRGFEAKLSFADFTLGYAWADQYLNEWDNRYRDLANNFTQGRIAFVPVETINYIHSIGLIYNFGPDKKAFIDAGYGEANNYRRNAQLAAVYPFAIGEGSLTATVYAFWGKYLDDLYAGTAIENEFVYAASAEYSRSGLNAALAFAYTDGPNSGEMEMGLAPYGNSDKRIFAYVRSQLDEHMWNGLKTFKLSADYDIGSLFGLPNLVFGASLNYGWGLIVPGQSAHGTMMEIDYFVEYTFTKGLLDGLSASISPAHLRTDDFYNGTYGKPDADDIQLMISYTKMLK